MLASYWLGSGFECRAVGQFEARILFDFELVVVPIQTTWETLYVGSGHGLYIPVKTMQTRSRSFLASVLGGTFSDTR